MKHSLEKLCNLLLHPVSGQNMSSLAHPPTTLTFLVCPQCCTQNLDLGSLRNGSIQLQISHQLWNKSIRQMVSVIVAVEKPMKNPSSQAFCDDDQKSIFSFIFEEGT
uniref:Interleukin-1 propeptide domain-containing protein n=1 Tax=Sus scrofa TaxID=9823 RepID=A0A8D0NV66_PIG